MEKNLALVKPCLFNWLGYGQINSSIWFIGTEEGGAEIWRYKVKTLESSLKLRKDFKLSMDFYHVWQELYGIDLQNFKGPTVWRYIANFLLNFENKKDDKEDIRKFIFLDKKLGRLNSDHFLCEFFPLPKLSKNNIDPYNYIWKNIHDYYEEVKSKRFSLINESLKNNSKIKLVVSYEKKLTELILEHYKHNEIKKWFHKKENYYLYKININIGRHVFLLATPFFGQGRISYDGIRLVVKKLKKLMII